MREKSFSLDAALMEAGIPLEVYETGRVPARQVELYARGRGTGTPGKHVTNARAWEGYHQYGMAEDRVFKVAGQWTWDEPERGMWKRYQAIAEGIGLRTLSFETPHVELPLHLTGLRAGVYPPGGDASWRDWLEEQIELWGPEARTIAGIVHPGAPPLFIDRPALVA